MTFFHYILQDWRANKANGKGRFILINFRFAQLVRRNKLLLLFFFWYLLIYRFLIEWFMCVELPWGAIVGPNFQLYHGHALVIHPHTVIGSNCVIRQSTTIGNKQDKEGGYNDICPVIGNNVNIGANVCIIGSIKIGNNVSIGAGTVVVKDIPDGSVVVGNPARIING